MRLSTHDPRVDALRRAPLFESLSKKELRQLARVCENLDMPAGQALAKEGALGREFFVIVDGKVKVTRKGRRLAMLGPGDFAGEIALLENTRRTATLTAETPVRLFVLAGRDFRGLLNNSPSVERKVLRALARRVLELSKDPTLA